MTSPSTAFLAPTTVLAGFYVLLGLRVVYLRVTLRIGLGEGEVDADPARRLQRAVRVQANFGEWVPVTLLALLVADLRGAGPSWVAALGAALCFARLCHAVGLSRSGGAGLGRTAGTALTFTVLVGALVMAWMS